jgi:DNA polymerase-3 subunit chi
VQVSFHFNVADPADYVCRLIRKARLQRLSVLVCAEGEDVLAVDQALWAPTNGFVPHALHGAPRFVRDASPVYLCTELEPSDSANVLVNLRSQMCDHLQNYGRLIEVVTPDERVRLEARRRWKHFANLGWIPEGFDARAR